MSTNSMDSEALKRLLLELLRSDPVFRRAAAAELGLLELLERMDRLEERMLKLEERVARLEEQMVRLQEQVKNLQEQVVKLWEAVKTLQEQVAKLWEAVKTLEERMDRFEDKLNALGARWGIYAEEAFREGLKRFLQEYLGVARVGKWEYFDREGRVFGYPALVEIDVVVKEDTHYLVEVKSSVSAGDVRVFVEKCRLYREVVKPKKLKMLMVTCYADERAREAARALGVEIVTR